MVSAGGTLHGVRVVDYTRFVSGSYAGMLLAALGADVVKIESGSAGDPYRHQGTAFVDGRSALFDALNTGKRSVLLDLSTDAGHDALESLLATADVFLENGRPGSLRRHGLDAASVRGRHPHLVYGSISGYGQVGPDAHRGGFDLILQAEGALMSVTGSTASGPVKVGAPVLDIGSAVSCALGIVSALFARERGGAGATVSSSLLEFAAASFTSVAPAYFVNGEVPRPLGSHSPTFAPYGAFRARDGHVVLAGAGSEDLWHRFCRAIGAEHLSADDRYADNTQRVRRVDELAADIERVLAGDDVDTWLKRLTKHGVPASRVRHLGEMLESEQIAALGLIREHHGVRQIGPPLQIDGPLQLTRRAPALGEHTAEVLDKLARHATMPGRAR